MLPAVGVDFPSPALPAVVLFVLLAFVVRLQAEGSEEGGTDESAAEVGVESEDPFWSGRRDGVGVGVGGSEDVRWRRRQRQRRKLAEGVRDPGGGAMGVADDGNNQDRKLSEVQMRSFTG